MTTRNSVQTGQLNSLFHTFADLANSVVARQTTDWSVLNSQFSPNVINLTLAMLAVLAYICYLSYIFMGLV